MKAIVCHELTGPAALRLEDVPEPCPGPGQVRIRVRACGTGRKRLAVAISLQPEEKEALERICAELGMTQSDFVRLALKHGAVLAALHREG